MFNYNREVYLYNRQQEVKELERAKRQAYQLHPHEDHGAYARGKSWFANQVFWPGIDATSRVLGDARGYSRRYWHRGYTRLLGLVFNSAAHLKELLPRRPSMA